MFKLLYSYIHFTCSKSFKPGFSSTRTENFQIFKLDLEKAGESEIKLPTSTVSKKNKRIPPKTSASASLTAKAFDCIDHNKQWEIQEMGTPDHLNCLLKIL